MEVTSTYNSFWLIIFSFLTIIAVIIGLIITKSKDNNLFGNIFSKHTDEHIDTTDKFSKAHTEVIALPKVYEDELHNLESDVKDIQERLIETTEDINKKLDLLIERVAKLEHISYNKNNNK